MKKILAGILVMAMVVSSFTGCGGSNSTIYPITREDSSGTRGAFMEIIGFKDTVGTAEISNSTSVVIGTVEGNESAIGYISLAALKDNVKGIKVDGVTPTVENIKNGTYKVARPFNIATNKNVESSDLAKDFIKYIQSAEGQTIVEDGGVISEGNTGSYQQKSLTGTLKISGSTSVYPIMEVLAEEYMKLNKGVSIEIQGTGSSSGMKDVLNGSADIGMASREIKASEIESGCEGVVIGIDGIAVIVNNDNVIDTLTIKQIKEIYTGVIGDWKELN